MPTSPPKIRVAVVGAGLSGLRAAQRLQTSGRASVRLFEKARGVGGRTAMRRAGPYAFDHGAQYFTARDVRFRAQVDAWVQAGVAAPFDKALAGIPRDGSLQFRESDPTERFVGVPGMTAMAKEMARGLDVELGVRVASLGRVGAAAGGSWTLDLGEGRTEAGFDVVLVTTPAAQAEPLVAASADLRAAAASVVMDPCWAVMVVFGERYDVPADGAFIESGALTWTCRNSSKEGRPEGDAWVLHASPAWTREHMELERNDVAERLVEALAESTGVPSPATVHTAAHRWMYAGARAPRQDGALYDPELGLGLAGDWINGSKVQGAWLSGDLLADRVLDEIDSSPGAAL